ncbi:hypothetical protein B0H13DRAFT_2357331 [Mycena leptocephala]|nr:hypothetical protein B0H13DRAFT_2357331 [Mycena leptocephala]
MNVQPSVFSLPNEILVAIVAAAAEDDYVDFPLEQGGDHPEWTVSQVSRRFRDIVIGAPTLWTVVEVHLILKESIEIFKLYLERSRGCKIWANLREVSWDREIVPHHVIAEGLSHIVPHIKRIQRLCIMSNPESVAAMLAPFQYAEAPYLEYLQLRVPGFWLRSMEIFPPEAPRLTRFVLHGFRPRFPVPQWAGTLTHLEYWETEDEKDEDGNSFFATIVSQCSSLVHLYVDTLQMRYRGSPLRIPTLKSLHLLINPDADDALDLLKVVELFDTPAVTDLTFDYAHGDHICVLFNPTSVPRSVFPA